MTGLSGLTALDFTDDRLTTLLKRLSKVETWQLIERPVDGGAAAQTWAAAAASTVVCGGLFPSSR
jgi:hypothetical protein